MRNAASGNGDMFAHSVRQDLRELIHLRPKRNARYALSLWTANRIGAELSQQSAVVSPAPGRGALPYMRSFKAFGTGNCSPQPIESYFPVTLFLKHNLQKSLDERRPRKINRIPPQNIIGGVESTLP